MNPKWWKVCLSYPKGASFRLFLQAPSAEDAIAAARQRVGPGIPCGASCVHATPEQIEEALKNG